MGPSRQTGPTPPPWVACHQLRHGLRGLQLPVQQGHHAAGERHINTQVFGALQHGARAVNTFGHMAQSGDCLFQAGTLGQCQADLAVARQIAVAVSTRSPRPLSPVKVCARAPSATPNRVISARPR